MECLKTNRLYRRPDSSIAYSWLTGFEYPWEALSALSEFIVTLGKTLPSSEYTQVGEDIWIANSATVAKTAFIGGPCIICANAEVRHCAFIRGSAIVGCGAVVGNSTELKNCILFDGVQVPHYNYVGDSILGYLAHMGAGAVTSNVKGDRSLVTVHCDGTCMETGRKKVGAMLGDLAEIGCNSVLNPGTVIGVSSTVYPLSSVRGYVPEQHIFKKTGLIVKKTDH